MKKTVLALALAAAMVGSLTACGGGSKTESTAAPRRPRPLRRRVRRRRVKKRRARRRPQRRRLPAAMSWRW